jgi:hypothetical protein
VPLLVIGIVSPVSGTVSVPFPIKVAIVCVSFIEVTPVFVATSSQTGCDDNSNPDEVLVVVLLPVVVVVVAATGVIAPPDITTTIIVANATRVAAVITT